MNGVNSQMCDIKTESLALLADFLLLFCFITDKACLFSSVYLCQGIEESLRITECHFLYGYFLLLWNFKQYLKSSMSKRGENQIEIGEYT